MQSGGWTGSGILCEPSCGVLVTWYKAITGVVAAAELPQPIGQQQ